MDGSVTEASDRFNDVTMSILDDELFERLRRIGRRLAGLELFERHRELLDRRFRRLGMRDANSIVACLDAAECLEPAATQRIVGLLTTKHTGFFRHPRHFDIAAEHLLWVAHASGSARAWCAGAATGEEPYSLAMALREVFRGDTPRVSILATDIDADALALARRAEYGEKASHDLDEERRGRFFSRTKSGWSVAPSVRDLVEFRSLNLVDPSWDVGLAFAVIFCRNALMYLAAPHRIDVLERMASLLAPAGLLFLDPTEHLGSATHLFTPRGNGVYSRPRREA